MAATRTTRSKTTATNRSTTAKKAAATRARRATATEASRVRASARRSRSGAGLRADALLAQAELVASKVGNVVQTAITASYKIAESLVTRVRRVV